MAAGVAVTCEEIVSEEFEAMPSPDASTLHSLIYEYLIHNCYSETALSFGSAACCTNEGQPVKPSAVDAEGDLTMSDDNIVDSATTSSTLDKKPVATKHQQSNNGSNAARASLEMRLKLKSLVTEGKIQEAIEYFELSLPGVLTADSSPNALHVYFELLCQQFIEYVRQNSPLALNFAQKELGKFTTLDAKYVTKLVNITALIAYKDPHTSPLSRYLLQSRRDEVADQVNSFILGRYGAPSITAIEKLAKQATVLRDHLHTDSLKDKKGSNNKIVYPKWQLSEFVGL